MPRRGAGQTEGERWARQELERLIAGRLGPRACAGFLRASFVRASEVRAARPALARQERRWALGGGAAWLGLWALRVPPFRDALGRGLGGWGVTVLMLDWHLGMVETEDGRPRPLGPADALTLARAWLIPAVADRPVPLLCAAGFATDVLDGPLARATQPTRLGRDLEGLVDACFEVALIRGLRRRRALGRPAATLEVVRVALGVAYGLASYFGRAEPPSRSVLGAARIVTPLRAAALLAAARHHRGGDGLVIAGSLLSAATLGRAVARP